MKAVVLMLGMALTFCIIFGTVVYIGDPTPQECTWVKDGYLDTSTGTRYDDWNCTDGIMPWVIFSLIAASGAAALATWTAFQLGKQDIERKKLSNDHDRYVIGSGRN